MNRFQQKQPTVYCLATSLKSNPEFAQHCNARNIFLESNCSIESFLSLESACRPCCVLSDVGEHNGFGVSLLTSLNERYCNLPVIFCVEDIQVDAALRLMEHGAFTIQRSSIEPKRLMDYVIDAIRLDHRYLQFDFVYQRVTGILSELTQRQSIILDDIADGLPTKLIAIQLGISERLVEKERSEILRRFQATATPDVTLMLGEFRAIQEMRQRKFDDRRSLMLKTYPDLRSDQI